MLIGRAQMVVNQASGGGAETITLSGTSGLLNANTDSDSAINPDDAQLEWEFRTDGTVWVVKANAADSQFQSGTEWSDATPSIDYWIRFTDDAGDSMNVGTKGSWLKLAGTSSANRSIGVSETTDGVADTTGTAKVEIATDSGGSNIVATGYYGGTADVS